MSWKTRIPLWSLTIALHWLTLLLIAGVCLYRTEGQFPQAAAKPANCSSNGTSCLA